MPLWRTILNAVVLIAAGACVGLLALIYRLTRAHWVFATAAGFVVVLVVRLLAVCQVQLFVEYSRMITGVAYIAFLWGFIGLYLSIRDFYRNGGSDG